MRYPPLMLEQVDELFLTYPEGHQYYIPLLLGFACELRIGEAFALTVDDLDLKRRIMHVNRQCQYKNGQLYFSEPVGGKRVEKIDYSVNQILKRHVYRMAESRSESNYICTNPVNGKYVHHWAMWYISKKYPWFKFSKLRQSRKYLLS